LREKEEKMSKVILIASGKGGTGKTVFTANTGAVLAQRGHKVALIDMDLGIRNLDLCFGLEDKIVYDIIDVLTGLCRIKQALVRDKRFNCLYLMASPPNGKNAEITPLHMKVLYKKLRKNFDYILVDSPAGINDTVLTAAENADSAVIITVPEHAALRNADILYTTLEKKGMTNIKYVLNKVKGDLVATKYIPGINEIAQRLRTEIAGIIHDDDNIHIAANNGFPIVLKKGTYIEQNFNKIADKITE